MAKDAKPAEDGAEAPPKKSKKLLIIIVAAILILAIAGAGAFFLLKGGDHAEDDEEAATETTKPKKKKGEAAPAPVFVNLETFTVNLIPEAGDQYLQVILALELEDATADVELKTQMPKVRNNIMLLLSSKKASELLSKEGKENLAEALKEEVNDILVPPKRNKKGTKISSEGPVKSVLFTSFIIQ
ncbi:MAG: hypothetical protein ACD_10C00096G0002 [uncultured bacterium]|nr:MAG: hypothetical protein ACD_10C00096G0002 [uncultured bacterium]